MRTRLKLGDMKPARRPPIQAIIRDAIERVTGDPHQARREVVQAILDDLAAAGLAIKAQTPARPDKAHATR
jgi:hypothetical protein